MSVFNARLTEIKNTVDQRIAERLAGRTLPQSLYEPIRYVMEGKGKRLRPLLVALSCEAVGGTVTQALDAAVAVELLHNFTLVHDDIMDRDETRRGRLTVHKKWDTDVALLAGDGLIAMAYQSLLKLDTPRLREVAKVFTDGLLEICEGQALDREFEGLLDVTPEQYIVMIEKKTARLLSLCCEVGALVGDGTSEEIRTLRDFGHHLGRAFQIQDDLLDITAAERVLGKDWGSDIKQRKVTFLLVDALVNADATQRANIRWIMQRPNLGAAEITLMRALFEEIGSVARAHKAIDESLIKAEGCLEVLRPTQARVDLRQLLQWIAARQS